MSYTPANPQPGAIENQMRVDIRQIGIPPRPAIIIEIDREFAKDAPDFSRLAAAISSDVSLSGALIKTTNSPYFGFQKKVRTVSEALLVLGLRLIVQTIAGLSLNKVFASVPHMERFWDASAKTALASAWLAGRLRKQCGIRPEDAYTFGLFRDCGIPIMMNAFPEYRDVLRQANDEPVLSFTSIEEERLSINHADLGAGLANSWLLPGDIEMAIRHHHDLRLLSASGASQIPAVSRTLIAIAMLAEHLVQVNTGLAQSHEWDKVADVAKIELDLHNRNFADLEHESAKVLGDMR
jgi:HD-like signal output (HDOD) protein